MCIFCWLSPVLRFDSFSHRFLLLPTPALRHSFSSLSRCQSPTHLTSNTPFSSPHLMVHIPPRGVTPRHTVTKNACAIAAAEGSGKCSHKPGHGVHRQVLRWKKLGRVLLALRSWCGHASALICALSYVCFHICPLICFPVLAHIRALSHLTTLLSYVCPHVLTYVCFFMCMLSCMCVCVSALEYRSWLRCLCLVLFNTVWGLLPDHALKSMSIPTVICPLYAR